MRNFYSKIYWCLLRNSILFQNVIKDCFNHNKLIKALKELSNSSTKMQSVNYFKNLLVVCNWKKKVSFDGKYCILEI